MGRLSLSAAANMLVDEGLRMHEHPGVLFRTGPTGRERDWRWDPTSGKSSGRSKGARAAEPELGEHDLLSLVAENTGVPVRVIRLAIGYWAAYPEEIDAEIVAADSAEESAEQRGGASVGSLPDSAGLASTAAPRRLLLDEMLSPAIAEQLCAKGYDVQAVAANPEYAGLPDEEILVAATEAGRSLVTDKIKDFVPLDARYRAANRSHAGLILLSSKTFPQDRTFVAAVVTALSALLSTSEEPLKDQVIFAGRVTGAAAGGL